MRITGMMAIGNGESCSFCHKILDDRIEKDMIIKHLFGEHKSELFAKLCSENNIGTN